MVNHYPAGNAFVTNLHTSLESVDNGQRGYLHF